MWYGHLRHCCLKNRKSHLPYRQVWYTTITGSVPGECSTKWSASQFTSNRMGQLDGTNSQSRLHNWLRLFLWWSRFWRSTLHCFTATKEFGESKGGDLLLCTSTSKFSSFYWMFVPKMASWMSSPCLSTSNGRNWPPSYWIVRNKKWMKRAPKHFDAAFYVACVSSPI